MVGCMHPPSPSFLDWTSKQGWANPLFGVASATPCSSLQRPSPVVYKKDTLPETTRKRAEGKRSWASLRLSEVESESGVSPSLPRLGFRTWHRGKRSKKHETTFSPWQWTETYKQLPRKALGSKGSLRKPAARSGPCDHVTTNKHTTGLIQRLTNPGPETLKLHPLKIRKV